MMNFKLEILKVSNSEKETIIIHAEKDETRQWRFTVKNRPLWESKSRRFGRCIIELRQMMEDEGFILLCNASRVNVASFNRAAILKNGTRGYVLSLSKEFGLENTELIELLDPLDESGEWATIQQQDDYFKQWSIFNGIPTDR
jgi:hypothetical protein